MKFEDLSPELQEKAKACETPEEFIALAKESGYELTEEELEAVSGGLFQLAAESEPNCTDVCKFYYHEA